MDIPVIGVIFILCVCAVLFVVGTNTFFKRSTTEVVNDEFSSNQPHQPRHNNKNTVDHLDHHGADLEGHFEQRKHREHKHLKHSKTSKNYGNGNGNGRPLNGAQMNRRQQLADDDDKDFDDHPRRRMTGGEPGVDAVEVGDSPVAAALIFESSPVRVLHEDNHNTIYDVVVAGAGPSGLTAALFASRSGLSVHVLGSSATGLLSQTKHLDNFPSFVGAPTRSGPEWVEATLEQAKSWGATFGPPGLLATSIERQRIARPGETKEDNEDNEFEKDVFFSLSTGDKSEPEVRGWSVVVASGATPKTLGLPGEDSLWGNSLHNCAICDGHLYQETEKSPSTTVLVVGGGDAALDAALLLARYATKVILVHRRHDFTTAHNIASLERTRETKNIEVLTSYVVNEWIAKKDDPSQLVGAKLVSTGSKRKTKQVDIDGAFVMIGATPNTRWTKNLGLANEEGLIKTTATTNVMSSGSMLTASSVPGLFAAGEVTDKIYKQAITAAAAGAQAAIDAERWLREQRGVVAGGSHHAGAAGAGAASIERRTMDHDSVDTVKVDQKTPGQVDCDLVSEACIRSIVGKYPVVVFSKTACPYCRKAMEALSRAGLSETNNPDKLLVINLSHYSNTQEIQSTLQTMTGRRTVPNVFVGGKSIGGGDETHGFQQSGKLIPMLEEAGALGDHPMAKPEIEREMAEEEIPAETESCDLSSEDCMRKVIKEHPVLLFSLEWCPWCKRTLELLDRIGVARENIHIIDLDDYKSIEPDIRANMKAISGWRSVPNLFVGGEWIGGYTRTEELHDLGELETKFRKVGALPRS